MILRFRRLIWDFISLYPNSMFCSNHKIDPNIEVLEHKAYLASKIISVINSFDIDMMFSKRTK